MVASQSDSTPTKPRNYPPESSTVSAFSTPETPIFRGGLPTHSKVDLSNEIKSVGTAVSLISERHAADPALQPDFHADIEDLTIAEGAIVRGSVERLLEEDARRRHPSRKFGDPTEDDLGSLLNSFENRNFALVSPRFGEQELDTSRTTTFLYNNMPSHMEPEGWPTLESSEHEALVELDAFLQFFVDESENLADNPAYAGSIKLARSLLDTLTFIGDKEFNQAIEIIGHSWKRFLDQDSTHAVFIVTGVTDSAKYPGKIKSDMYVREKVLETFDEEDRYKYGDRIFSGLDGVQGHDPKDTKIVLIDDWIISGRQMRRVYDQILSEPDMTKFISSIEANVIVASRDRARNGLLSTSNNLVRTPLKVKSAFVANLASFSDSESEAHISGLHGTVNYDFAEPLQRMVDLLYRQGIIIDMPALASVVSPYKINDKADA